MSERVQGTPAAQSGTVTPVIIEAVSPTAPQLDVSRLTDTQRAQYDQLINLRGEAYGWQRLNHKLGEDSAERAEAQLRLIDATIVALGHGHDVPNMVLEITQNAIRLAWDHPVSDNPPEVDVSGYPEDARRAHDWLVESRTRMLSVLDRFVEENRPDLARAVALMIHQADEGILTLAANPSSPRYNKWATKIIADIEAATQSPRWDAPIHPVEQEAANALLAPSQAGAPAEADAMEPARPSPTIIGASDRDAIQDAQIQANANAMEALEAEREEDARRPGLLSAAVEASEFALRALPIIGNLINLISAIINGLRLLWMIIITIAEYVTGKEEKTYDWKEFANTVLRVGTDIAGVYVPLVGAIGDQVADFAFNSEFLGRQETRFLGIGMGTDNLLMHGLREGSKWGTKTINQVKRAFGSDEPTEEAAIDYRPQELPERPSVSLDDAEPAPAS